MALPSSCIANNPPTVRTRTLVIILGYIGYSQPAPGPGAGPGLHRHSNYDVYDYGYAVSSVSQSYEFRLLTLWPCLWGHGAMGPWGHGAMGPWGHGAMVGTPTSYMPDCNQ